VVGARAPGNRFRRLAGLAGLANVQAIHAVAGHVPADEHSLQAEQAHAAALHGAGLLIPEDEAASVSLHSRSRQQAGLKETRRRRFRR
jgi:hypothetical protein